MDPVDGNGGKKKKGGTKRNSQIRRRRDSFDFDAPIHSSLIEENEKGTSLVYKTCGVKYGRRKARRFSKKLRLEYDVFCCRSKENGANCSLSIAKVYYSQENVKYFSSKGHKTRSHFRSCGAKKISFRNMPPPQKICGVPRPRGRGRRRKKRIVPPPPQNNSPIVFNDDDRGGRKKRKIEPNLPDKSKVIEVDKNYGMLGREEHVKIIFSVSKIDLYNRLRSDGYSTIESLFFGDQPCLHDDKVQLVSQYFKNKVFPWRKYEEVQFMIGATTPPGKRAGYVTVRLLLDGGIECLEKFNGYLYLTQEEFCQRIAEESERKKRVDDEEEGEEDELRGEKDMILESEDEDRFLLTDLDLDSFDSQLPDFEQEQEQQGHLLLDLNRTDAFGTGYLEYFIAHGRLDLVKFLVEKHGYKVEYDEEDEDDGNILRKLISPMDVAQYYKQDKIIEYIQEQISERHHDEEVKNIPESPKEEEEEEEEDDEEIQEFKRLVHMKDKKALKTKIDALVRRKVYGDVITHTDEHGKNAIDICREMELFKRLPAQLLRIKCGIENCDSPIEIDYVKKEIRHRCNSKSKTLTKYWKKTEFKDVIIVHKKDHLCSIEVLYGKTNCCTVEGCKSKVLGCKAILQRRGVILFKDF